MLPEEITKFIGQATGVTTYKVEQGAIARYADAVGDPNPLYLDEEYAKNSKYGSIIAPPGFFGWPVRQPRSSEEPEVIMGARRGPNFAEIGLPRVLDGGMEYDFIKPVKAGDTLTAESQIKDIRERTGSTGRMAFLIRETTFTNQDGEVVVKTRSTSIHR